MKTPGTLYTVVIVANLPTIVLYDYVTAQQDNTGYLRTFAFFWMAAVWIVTTAFAVIMVAKRRRRSPAQSSAKWTVLTMLLCTPFPIFLLYQLIHPAASTPFSSMTIRYENGKVYKTEQLYYTTDYKTPCAEMFFVADSLEEKNIGNKAFKRDSTWTYFSRNGDTAKTEYYKDGILISAIEN